MPPDTNPPALTALGDTGILFADLSGYTQLVYQCVGDEERLQRLGLAMYRLFNTADDQHPDVIVEGYAGDGFLALSTGKRPAKAIYDFAMAVHERFDSEVRSLLLNLGFRVSVSLRTGMHVGKVWRMPTPSPGVEGKLRVEPEQEEDLDARPDVMGHDHPLREPGLNISDAIVVASRVVTGQTSRRFGMGLTRTCYKRLMLAGGKDIREPDEVIQDRNQYPEPVEVYRLLPEEHQKIRGR